MHIYKTNFLVKKLYNSFVWDIPSKEKAIYLTFDDGPIPVITEFVLNELEKVNAKATFFTVGQNIEKHPDVFQKVLQGGHSIGNHTYNHLNGWKTSVDEYLNNISICDKVLSANILNHNQKQGKSNLFRPPYGKMTRKQISIIKNTHQVIMWDVLTGDYDRNIDPEVCLKKSIKYTKSGSIIIFHDSLKAEKNLRYVLPRYLAHFKALGYTFKAL